MRKLTKQKRGISVLAKTGEDIDFSDAPPVLDWDGAEIGKFYRPKKKPVTMRLDSGVNAWLKAYGPGHQTRANWLLRPTMTHFAEGNRSGSRRRTQRLPRSSN